MITAPDRRKPSGVFLCPHRSPRNAPERTQAGGIIQIYLNARKSPQRGTQKPRRVYFDHTHTTPGRATGTAPVQLDPAQGIKQAPAGYQTCGAFVVVTLAGGFSDQFAFGVFLRPFCAFCGSAGISAITSAPSALSGRNALALSRYFCLRASMFG